jgi:hypothetical protein
MLRLSQLLRKLASPHLNAATKSGSVRPTENLDGMTAAHSGRELDTGGDGGGIPPGLRQVV